MSYKIITCGPQQSEVQIYLLCDIKMVYFQVMHKKEHVF